MNWLFFALGMLTQHCLVMIIGRHIHNKRQKAINGVLEALANHPDRIPNDNELPDGVSGLCVEVFDANGRQIEPGSDEYRKAVSALKLSQDHKKQD